MKTKKSVIGLAVVAGLVFALTLGAQAANVSAKAGTLQKLIANNSVLSRHIQNGTIVAADLADGAVITDKIADNSITSLKLVFDSVTGNYIAADAVGASEIAAGAVGTSEIANDAITSAQIADGAIVADGIATGAVTTTEILDSTIVSADIAANTIVAADIAADAVGASELADNSVASANIIDGTIVAADIAEGGVATSEILDGTILVGDLADGAVTSAKILDGTILGADLGSGIAITTSGTANFTGDVNLGSTGYDIVVDSDAWFVDVNGYAWFYGTTTSTGAIYANGGIANTDAEALAINANGAQKIILGGTSTGDIDLTRNTNALAGLDVTGALTVSTTSDLTGLLTANGGLTVVGTLTLPALSVADAALSANVSLLGQTIESAEITDGTIVAGDLATNLAITTTGLASLNGGIAVDANFTVDGTTGAVVSANTITGTGVYSSGGAFDGTSALTTLHVGESLNLGLVLSGTGKSTTVAGTFNVDEAATFDSTVGTTGLLTANGGLTVVGDLKATPQSAAGTAAEGVIYYDSDDDNLYVYANAGWVDLTAGASGAPTLDDAYNAGSGVETEIHVDNGGLTLSSEDTTAGGGDIIVDLTNTGDFYIADTGVAFATFDNSGNVAFTGTLGVTGATTVTGALYANGGLDRSAAAALAIGGTNATSIGIGGASNTALTVTTDGTGTAEVVLPAGSIDSTEILNETIVSADIFDGTIAAGDLATDIAVSTTGSVATTGAGTMTSAGLVTANGGLTVVGTLTLPAASVADAALSANVSLLGSAIASSEITDGTIATADIADGAVTAPKLQAAAADLGAADVTVNFGNTNGAFNTNITTDGTMTATAGFVGALTGAVTGNADTVTAGVYTTDTGTVTSTMIADGTVVSADIAADTIVAADIATGGVGTLEIEDSSIVSADIAANTIIAADIATGGVGTDEILDGTIIAADIASGAVTAPKLQAAAADLGAADVTVNFGNTNGAFNTNITTDGTMTATTFIGALTGNVTGTVSGNAGTVTSGVYTTDTGTVTSTMIADGTIVAADIATSGVATAEILNGTILAEDLATDLAITTTGLSSLDGGIAVDTSNFTVSGITGDVLTAGDLDVNGDDIDADGVLDITGGTGMDVNTTAGNIVIDPVDAGAGSVLPETDSEDSIGADATRWATIFADTLNYSTALTDSNSAATTVTMGDSVTLDAVNITANTAITDGEWSVTNAGVATFASAVAGAAEVNGAITLANDETISNAVDGAFLFSRNTAGTVTITAADNDSNADLLVNAGGTGDITLGDADSNVTVASGLTITAGGIVITDGGLDMTGDNITNGGTITATTFSGALTGNVTGNVSGTAATVTTAAQPAITSVGTLTGLTSTGTVDFSGATSVDFPNVVLGAACTVSGSIGVAPAGDAGERIMVCNGANWLAN